eukprot:EG_transcript_21251
MRVTGVLHLLCLLLPCWAELVDELEFDLPLCSHDFRHAEAADKECHFTTKIVQPTPSHKNARKHEVLVCSLAYDPRLQLPWGIARPCVLNGTVIAPDAALYVEEVKKAVLGYHVQAFPGQVDGSRFPPGHMSYVLSMVGFRRLHHVQALLEDAVFRGVPGDFIETGVWRGGLCLVAAAVFRAYGQAPRRKVWLADSFAGIPPPTFAVDKRYHKRAHQIKVLTNNSLAAVQASFQKFGLAGDGIRWLPGYFNETLPRARSLWTSFAVIRLDGDIYQSVYESFVNLYPFLSPGGYVIIDDYWDWVG